MQFCAQVFSGMIASAKALQYDYYKLRCCHINSRTSYPISVDPICIDLNSWWPIILRLRASVDPLYFFF